MYPIDMDIWNPNIWISLYDYFGIINSTDGMYARRNQMHM